MCALSISILALTEKLEETTEALRRTEGEGEAALESLKNQVIIDCFYALFLFSVFKE